MKLIEPCPFCGSKETITKSAMDEWWILCAICKASTDLFATREAAVDAWCRRPLNQEVTTSQNPCDQCEAYECNTTDMFCRDCGMALDR